MKEYVIIYNKYTLSVVCNRLLWQKKNIQFLLNHPQKLLSIDTKNNLLNSNNNILAGLQNAFTKNINYNSKMNIVKNIDSKNFYNDLHGSYFKWFKLKKLLINYLVPISGVAQNVIAHARHGQGFDDEKYSQQQTEIMSTILDKMYNNILSLTVRNIQNLTLFRKDLHLERFPKIFHLRLENNFDRKVLSMYNYNHLLALEMYGITRLKEVGKNVTQLYTGARAFQHTTPNIIDRDDETDDIETILNMIFKNCTQLKVFYCMLGPKMRVYSNPAQMSTLYNKKTVKFPPTLQFLYLSQIESWFNIDISSCNNLVTFCLSAVIHTAVNSSNIDEFIKWPKLLNCLIISQNINNAQLLPNFVNHFYKYLRMTGDTKWNYENKPNIRFIHYLTKPKLIENDNQNNNETNQNNQNNLNNNNTNINNNPNMNNLNNLFGGNMISSYSNNVNINNRKTYNPINRYGNETITMTQLNEWTKALNINELLSLQNNNLILEVEDKKINESDLWKILLKLSNNEDQIQVYQNWFELDLCLWIKTMFTSLK